MTFFELLQMDIVRQALIMGLLSSIAFGIMGTYVVTRRISSIAGAIAHCALCGIGISLWLGSRGITWFTPTMGLIVSGIISALIIGAVSLWWKQREDTVIGSIWALGMAVGLAFYQYARQTKDATSYLFGDIQMVTPADLWHVAILDLFLLATLPFLYHKFQALCFDEEFARVRGLRVDFYYLLLLCLVGLSVVLFINIIGMIMIIALLTLPAATAGQFSRKLWQMMVGGAVLCALFTTGGILASLQLDISASLPIIIIAGGAYLLGLLLPSLWKRFVAGNRNPVPTTVTRA